MQSNTTLAQQISAAAPAATRNVKRRTNKEARVVNSADLLLLLAGGAVGPTGREFDADQLHSGASAAQFILGQKDIRDGMPSLPNRDNLI